MYIVFILVFLHMHNWLPDFQLETATVLPGIEIETATFLVESRNPRIPETQNPGILVELVESLPLFLLESYYFPRIPETRNPGILVEFSRIPATFFPGILLESATFFSGILVESATLFWNPRAYVRL